MTAKTKMILCAAAGLGGLVLAYRWPAALLLAAAGLAGLFSLALQADAASRKDPLTGLYNLRGLTADTKHWQRAARVCVLYLDVDNLKQINDTGGHGAGNAVLSRTAAAMRKVRGARAYRIGGDEFLMISARYTASALEKAWQQAGQEIPVSTGSAQGPGKDLAALAGRAEQAMYQKKRQK